MLAASLNSRAYTPPSQDTTGDVVLDGVRQMGLVHDRQHVIRSFHGVCDKARVLDNEDMVLKQVRIRHKMEIAGNSTCGSDTTAA